MRSSVRLIDAVRRLVWWSCTPTGLGVLFGVGLLIRLVLARGGGFPYDISAFQSWATRLVDRGPWNFYPGAGEDYFVDYPPGYLYVLYILGWLSKIAGQDVVPVLIIKLPPIFADLGLAWVVSELAVRLAPVGRRIPIRGLAAAAILLNPAIFFISAVWGQADAVHTLLVAGSFLLLGTAGVFGAGEMGWRREAAGMALLAAAVATKPQAILVVPAVLLILVWRHVRSRIVLAPDRRVAAAFAGVARVALSLAFAAIAGLVIFAPFGLWPTAAYDLYSKAARVYSVTSVFAFNLWGTVGFWRPDIGDDAFRVFGIPAFYVAITLFALGGTVVLARAWRALEAGQHEGRVLVLAGVAITLVGFAFLTRIHERYLFLAVALLAVFVGYRWLRWAFLGASALYYLNIYFPYQYYVQYVKRPAPLLSGWADIVYGNDVGGPKLKALSILTAVAAVACAWLAWRRFEPAPSFEPGAPSEPVTPTDASAEPSIGLTLTDEVPEPREPWTLRLHPVGRRGAMLAAAAFLVAFISRVAGLGHPPGMYFDEVYHVRTGAEYLNGKEVYEWTHPPLAKEIIGFSIDRLSGFGSTRVSPLPSNASPALFASGTTSIAWAVPEAGLTRVNLGTLDAGCRAEQSPDPVRDEMDDADAIAMSGDRLFLAGDNAGQSEIVRYDGGAQAWRAKLPGRASSMVALDDMAYVLTEDATLIAVLSDGSTNGVAQGAAAVAVSAKDGEVWASFPDRNQVVSWDRLGKRVNVVGVSGTPGPLSVPESSDRVLVGDTSQPRIEVVDTNSKRKDKEIGVRSTALATVRETGLGWSVDDKDVTIIEPRGASVIGRATLQNSPDTLIADPGRHRLVGISSQGLECVGGRPTFAWRFPSAVAGSLMVAFVLLIALRLFGNVLIAGLAALFLTIDGLAFTLSRIAMNDSFVTAFILGAWFCALGALYRWGGAEDALEIPSRSHALAWLAGSGVFGGLALASKWVGLYAIAGIGVLFLADAVTRGKDSIWSIAGNPVASAGVLAILFGVIPLSLYVLTYLPYFQLGHNFGELLKLQRDMFNYHANLDASHPFGSQWIGWPFGYRAVYLYLANHVGGRSEMWTVANPVVLLGGLAAMIFLVIRARATRVTAMAIVVVAATAQYLPWTAVGRVTFLYHYLPVMPFLAIALAWWIVDGLRAHPRHRELAAGLTGSAILFFFATLPLLEGWAMPAAYLDTMRDALFWMLP